MNNIRLTYEAFSACLPNPNPALLVLSTETSSSWPSFLATNMLETNDGGAALKTGRLSLVVEKDEPVWVGNIAFLASFQDVNERLYLTDWRKIKP